MHVLKRQHCDPLVQNRQSVLLSTCHIPPSTLLLFILALGAPLSTHISEKAGENSAALLHLALTPSGFESLLHFHLSVFQLVQEFILLRVTNSSIYCEDWGRSYPTTAKAGARALTPAFRAGQGRRLRKWVRAFLWGVDGVGNVRKSIPLQSQKQSILYGDCKSSLFFYHLTHRLSPPGLFVLAKTIMKLSWSNVVYFSLKVIF